jgi:hypothetical protein
MGQLKHCDAVFDKPERRTKVSLDRVKNFECSRVSTRCQLKLIPTRPFEESFEPTRLLREDQASPTGLAVKCDGLQRGFTAEFRHISGAMAAKYPPAVVSNSRQPGNKVGKVCGSNPGTRARKSTERVGVPANRILCIFQA